MLLLVLAVNSDRFVVTRSYSSVCSYALLVGVLEIQKGGRNK